MENLLSIGKRCSVLINEKIFSLVIIPTHEKRKIGILFLWLFAWTVSGLIVLMSYPKVPENAKIAIIIWLAFWAYFEFKIVRVFMWKRFGKEKLWVKSGTVFYQQEINGRGKIKEYDINLISDIAVLEVEKGNFSDTFNQSFWVKGGERIEFVCQGKHIKFGMQLNDEDANKTAAELKKFLKKF